MVLNHGISKTSKIRVFNSATLVALSRLYAWGLASKPGSMAAKKRRRKSSDTFQFTNVCMFLVIFFSYKATVQAVFKRTSVSTAWLPDIWSRSPDFFPTSMVTGICHHGQLNVPRLRLSTCGYHTFCCAGP